MSETIIMVWVGVVSILSFNGCAAGIVAFLHARRSRMRRGGRVVTAAVITGFLPASIFIPVGFTDPQWASAEGPMILGLAVGIVLVAGTVVALPGALLVARKLEAPGDEFRTFE